MTVELRSLSGNGWNDVTVRCSPETWNSLTNSTNKIAVRLKNFSGPDTSTYGVDPGHAATFLKYLTNVYYLFKIGGAHHSRATVEITFPNGPEKPVPAEINAGVTPADTGLESPSDHSRHARERAKGSVPHFRIPAPCRRITSSDELLVPISMGKAPQIAVLFAILCGFSACRPTSPEEKFVRQTIPIEIQSRRTVTVAIKSLSGNGRNVIAIRCSPELWSSLKYDEWVKPGGRVLWPRSWFCPQQFAPLAATVPSS